MPEYDARTGTCWIFTERRGLLAAVGHDLRIRAGCFNVCWDEVDAGESTQVRASFDPASLVVDCAMAQGAPKHGALSENDKKDIAHTIRHKVLHAERYPEIRFEGQMPVRPQDSFKFDGQLSLHGVTRKVGIHVKREDRTWVAEATVHQPDFSIAPYSALAGTLRLRPDVRVRVSVPVKD